MTSRVRENQAAAGRLVRARDILSSELGEQPFLPEEIKASLNGAIKYLDTRINVLAPTTTGEEVISG